MPFDIDPRDFGRVEASVKALEARVEAIEETMVAVRKNLHEIRTLLAGATGGWKMLMKVGGAGASLAAAAVWVASNVRLK